MPKDKHIYVTCPDCFSKFEFKNGINITSIPTTRTPLGKRILRIAKKIAIASVIVWLFSFLLSKTGWTKWEYFSQDADNFLDRCMMKSNKLSPFSLLKNYSIVEEPGLFGTMVKRGKAEWIWNCSRETVREKFRSWINEFWYSGNGDAFWPGRILLILIIIIAFSWAFVSFATAWDKHKLKASLLFPVNMVYRFLWLVYWMTALGLVFYLLAQILLFIAGGLVTLFTIFAATGGFLKILGDEIRQSAIDHPKNKMITYVSALYTRKK